MLLVVAAFKLWSIVNGSERFIVKVTIGFSQTEKIRVNNGLKKIICEVFCKLGKSIMGQVRNLRSLKLWRGNGTNRGRIKRWIG